MSVVGALGTAALLLFLSAVYAGSETGFYSLSRYRVEAEARAGRRLPRLILWLMRADAALLITLLIGNNVVLHALTELMDSQLVLEESFAGARELVMTAVLTPLVFFFGELLPKDLYHRRPNLLVGLTAPLVAFSRFAFWPLAAPLRFCSHMLERLLGLQGDSVARALGREAVVEFLEEGARSGSLDTHSQELLRNALELRVLEVASEMVPWEQVETVAASVHGAALREQAARSHHSRLIVVDEAGHVTGYVHQLDVLATEPEGVEPLLRPLVFFPPDLSVDRALTRLRIGGHRLAVVGSAERPLGLISLKDLVETLSGELDVW